MKYSRSLALISSELVSETVNVAVLFLFTGGGNVCWMRQGKDVGHVLWAAG